MLYRDDFPYRWPWMLAVAFVGKALIVALLLLEHGVSLNAWWFALAGDSIDYTRPVDLLLAGQDYGWDHRMPGYSFVYLPLRLLFSANGAMQALVLIQVLADALTVFLGARIAWQLSKDLRMVQFVFWISLLSTFVTAWDRYILTETFAAFALVLAMHGVSSERPEKTSTLLTTGLALAWLVFLKPVFLPLFALFTFAYLIRPSLGTLNERWRSVFLLLLPFLLLDAAWMIHNAVSDDRFQPLTHEVIAPQLQREVHYPLMQLMQSYGCNSVWQDPDAEIRWFLQSSDQVPTLAHEGTSPLPSYTHTLACPADSISRLAELSRYLVDNPADSATFQLVSAKCQSCIDAFQEEKPFHYQVTARLRLLKTFVLDSGTRSLMGRPVAELNNAKKAIKAGYSALYLSVMILGLLAAIWTAGKRSWPWLDRLVPLTLLYGVLIFPFGLRMSENRDLTTVYPLAVIFMVYLVLTLRDRIGKASASS